MRETKESKFLKIWASACLIVTASLIIVVSLVTATPANKKNFPNLQLIGTYRSDQDTWLDYSHGNPPSASQVLEFKGRVSEDLAPGESLFFFTSNLEISIIQNKAQIFTNANNSLEEKYIMAPTSGWQVVTFNQGLSHTDEFSMILTSNYRQSNAFSTFFNSLRKGDFNSFLIVLSNRALFSIVLALVTTLLSASLLATHFVLHNCGFTLAIRNSNPWICFAAIFWAIWATAWLPYMTLLMQKTVFLSFLRIIPFLFGVSCFQMAIYVSQKKESPFPTFVLSVQIAIPFLVTVLTFFRQLDLHLLFGPALVLSTITSCFVIVSTESSSDTQAKSLHSLWLCIIGLVSESANAFHHMFTSGTILCALTSIALLLRIIILPSKAILRPLTSKNKDRQELTTIEKVKKQLRPHFLFNILNNLSSLVYTDSALSDRTIADMADFLRASLDSLDEHAFSTFQIEMDHVKHYLNLESMCTGKKFKLIRKMPELEFTLPVNILLPLVEICIKHFRETTSPEGTILISTRRLTGNIIKITIEDNANAPNISDRLKKTLEERLSDVALALSVVPGAYLDSKCANHYWAFNVSIPGTFYPNETKNGEILK